MSQRPHLSRGVTDGPPGSSKPSQRLGVGVGGRAALRVGESRAVRRRVVGIRVADRVVDVVLAQGGWEVRLSHAAESVIGEEGRVRIGIRDAGRIVFGVVGVRGGLVVLVGYRRPPSPRWGGRPTTHPVLWVCLYLP